MRYLWLACLLVFIAEAGEWRKIRSVALAKDAFEQIIVKSGNDQKLLAFRWTLYKNGGLVVHRSYDGFVAQYVLYTRHKNSSFRLELSTRGLKAAPPPMLLVTFKSFDYEKNEAQFDLLLNDDDQRVELKYPKEIESR